MTDLQFSSALPGDVQFLESEWFSCFTKRSSISKSPKDGMALPGSTHVCELTFSVMNKVCHRSKLTD